MPSPHAQINPRLIAVLTGKLLNQVKVKPSLKDLPGKYPKMILANPGKIESKFDENKQYLICGHCGKKGRYDLGMVLMDGKRYFEDFKNGNEDKGMNSILEYCQSTGVFRCKQCNGEGLWSSDSTLLPLAILMGAMIKAGEASFSNGRLTMFDGFFPQWGTTGEEHLLDQIVKNPQDAYLWDRLGNLYHSGGRPELAAAAFEQALSIDPNQLESHFSLGDFLMQIGEWENAIFHYKKVVLHARGYDRMPLEKLRDLLAESLKNLVIMSHEVDQIISFLPEREEIEEVYGSQLDHNKDDSVLELVNFELDTNKIESFYGLAALYMGPRAKELNKNQRTKPMVKELGSYVNTVKEKNNQNKRIRIKGKLRKKKKKK